MAIPLIDKIKPKNNGTFAMVDAEDVAMPDGTRLSDKFPPVETPGGAVGAYIPTVAMTEEEYAALEESGAVQDGVLYALLPGGEDG